MNAIIKPVIIAILATTLAACGRPEIASGADNQVLCRPDTQEAFHVRPWSGATSIVTRASSADHLCQETENKEMNRAALAQGGE